MSSVAIVAGGSRGIGRACAIRLANDGFDHVVIGFRTDQESANSTRAAVEAAGATGHTVQGDTSVDADVGQLIDVGRAAGRVRAVVYAAGVRTLGPALSLDSTLWQRALDVNVTGFIRVAQSAAAAMESGGSIVAITGLSGLRAYSPQHLVMGTTKAAVHRAAGYLASSLAPRDINLNVVCCGATRTEGVERDLTPAQYAEFIEGAASRIPRGRIAEPAEIAAVISFLCSDDARLLVGQVLIADGGETLR